MGGTLAVANVQDDVLVDDDHGRSVVEHVGIGFAERSKLIAELRGRRESRMIFSSASLSMSTPVSYSSAKISALLCWTAFRISLLCAGITGLGRADQPMNTCGRIPRPPCSAALEG
jgi:hypothetical protein